ncbi:hypothetical protein [Streptomyces sp. NPDC001678]|uniref:hypothetical protein n=1 Tax=Streptomyces sp. NPDC001678 TaxID=3364599 RepID=UPI0036B0FECC
MKSSIRTALAAALAAAALLGPVVPAVAAGVTNVKNDQAVNAVNASCRVRGVAAEPSDTAGAFAADVRAMDARTIANPTRIKAAAYNQARSILAKAGSDTAAKSHPVHGTGDVPVGYGTNLLACARDEFRAKDKDVPVKRSGMSTYHYVAVHDAAATMGITRW